MAQLDAIIQGQLTATYFGTDIAVTPDRQLAVIANSIQTAEKDGVWSWEPAYSIHLIDLSGSKPELLETVTTATDNTENSIPSGLSISPDGKMVLVGNRKGQRATVFRISEYVYVVNRNQ